MYLWDWDVRTGFEGHKLKRSDVCLQMVLATILQNSVCFIILTDTDIFEKSHNTLKYF